MQIYCEKGRSPQRGTQRSCAKCGAPLGGGVSVLIIGGLLAVALPAIIATSSEPQVLRDPRVLFWFELPVLVGTAFLYDYLPRRRAVYFWGGAAAIVVSLIVLAS